MYSYQVKGKIYRLLYERNKKAKIRVNTPVGISQSKNKGPNVQPGTVEAGIISSGSVDNCLNVETCLTSNSCLTVKNL